MAVACQGGSTLKLGSELKMAQALDKTGWPVEDGSGPGLLSQMLARLAGYNALATALLQVHVVCLVPNP